MIQPEDYWEPWPVSVEHIGGPERIYDDAATGEPVRFLGFAPRSIEKEPMLWEGDDG